jgi:hypothetical protein
VTTQWKDIVGTVGGKAARILVDPTAQDAPDATRPNLLSIAVKLASPDGSGLSTKAEDEDLEDLRSVLAKVVDLRLHARLVGTITSGGTYTMYFYGASADGLDKAAGEALVDFEEYSATFGSTPDPAWDHVRTVMKG